MAEPDRRRPQHRRLVDYARRPRRRDDREVRDRRRRGGGGRGVKVGGRPNGGGVVQAAGAAARLRAYCVKDVSERPELSIVSVCGTGLGFRKLLPRQSQYRNNLFLGQAFKSNLPQSISVF